MIESKTQSLFEELKARNIELTTQNIELQLAKDKIDTATKMLHLFSDISTAGYFIIDDRGIILEVNSSGLSLLGKTGEELLNYTFSQFITKKNLLEFKLFLFKAKESKAKIFCVTELIINQEKHITVQLTVRFLEKKQQYFITAYERTEKKYSYPQI